MDRWIYHEQLQIFVTGNIGNLALGHYFSSNRSLAAGSCPLGPMVGAVVGGGAQRLSCVCFTGSGKASKTPLA